MERETGSLGRAPRSFIGATGEVSGARTSATADGAPQGLSLRARRNSDRSSMTRSPLEPPECKGDSGSGKVASLVLDHEVGRARAVVRGRLNDDGDARAVHGGPDLHESTATMVRAVALVKASAAEGHAYACDFTTGARRLGAPFPVARRVRSALPWASVASAAKSLA